MREWIDCEAMEASSLPLEKKPYYSQKFSMSSNLLQTGVPQKGKAIELAPYNREIRHMQTPK